ANTCWSPYPPIPVAPGLMKARRLRVEPSASCKPSAKGASNGLLDRLVKKDQVAASPAEITSQQPDQFVPDDSRWERMNSRKSAKLATVVSSNPWLWA